MVILESISKASANLSATYTLLCCPVRARYELPEFMRTKPFEYNLEKAKATLPVTLIFVGMISFNNLCLEVRAEGRGSLCLSLTRDWLAVPSLACIRNSRWT